ncbi:hypothetical protein M427DRAFT_93252, partial [Gonapodya prolifera JEL478]
THLVTDTKIKRTVKFLAALSEGKPIVSLSWLDECKRKGGVVDAASFILNDPAAETKWGFKLAESLASSAEKEGKLLDGREFFITPNTKPGNGDLKEIVEAAGGKVACAFAESRHQHSSHWLMFSRCTRRSQPRLLRRAIHW